MLQKSSDAVQSPDHAISQSLNQQRAARPGGLAVLIRPQGRFDSVARYQNDRGKGAGDRKAGRN